LLETNYEQGYHIMQVTQEDIARLLAAGLRVEPDKTWVAPPVRPLADASIQTIPSYSCYRTVEETYAAAQALATAHPNLATWIDAGNSWLKSVNQGGYDLILSPTLSIPPVKLGSFRPVSEDPMNWARLANLFCTFTYVYNLTGQPAMSVPLFWNQDNVPIGIQFAGRFGDEARLFRLAGQLEQARPWADRRPPIHCCNPD